MDSLAGKLISYVQAHPLLYDVSHKDYRNVKKKAKIWNEIGVELRENGTELKKKWKNLRDCYARYIRSDKVSTGQANKSTTRYYKSWPWAKQMEVFKPFLKFAQIESKIEISDVCSSRLHSQDRPSSEKSPKERNGILTQTRKRKHETENAVDKILKYLQEERKAANVHTSTLGATELMFLGFARTVSTFSAQRQSSVKMQIASIVLKEELLQREEEEGKVRNTLSASLNILSESERYISTEQVRNYY